MQRFCLMRNLLLAITVGASAEKICDEIQHLIETCGKDGGYIVSTGSEKPANVPGEKIQAIKRGIKDAGYFKRRIFT